MTGRVEPRGCGRGGPQLRRTGALALALALVAGLWVEPVVAQAEPEGDGFVRVRDGRFEIDGRPYYFLGANLWFGMNLGAEHASAHRDRLLRELDHLASLGVDNLRVMAATEGPADQPWRVHPAVQNAPGEYDARILRGLDVLLAEMARRDMRAVLRR